MGKLKKGTWCIIEKVRIVDGISYGKRKKRKTWIKMRNTKEK